MNGCLIKRNIEQIGIDDIISFRIYEDLTLSMNRVCIVVHFKQRSQLYDHNSEKRKKQVNCECN